MSNRDLIENMLKDYSGLKNRAMLIERLRSGEVKPIQPKLTEGSGALSVSKGKCNLKGTIQKQNAMINQLVENVKNAEQEIRNLHRSIRIIDEALAVLKGVNERYHRIVVEHFVHRIRIEDLEELFDLSRSRCYELRKRAVDEMTAIVFGNAS